MDHPPAFALPERPSSRSRRSTRGASSLPRPRRRTHNMDLPHMRPRPCTGHRSTSTARASTGQRPCASPPNLSGSYRRPPVVAGPTAASRAQARWSFQPLSKSKELIDHDGDSQQHQQCHDEGGTHSLNHPAWVGRLPISCEARRAPQNEHDRRYRGSRSESEA